MTLPQPVADDQIQSVHIRALSNAIATIQGRSYPVSDYLATGDDVTDDVPFIQAAIDAAGAAGGGDVIIDRPGRYRLISHQTGSGPLGDPSYIRGHLENPYDNVNIIGTPGAVLVADDTYPIFYQGNSLDGTVFIQDATTYTMDGPVARRATSITLTTHAQAGNFAPGDHIVIRTGQTINTGVDQPDAEINRVVSANASTGVIVLAWPTSKAYAQEYFVSGTAGFTSTGVTANLAAFGVANVQDRVVRNQSYIGLEFEHTGTGTESYAFIGGGCVNTRIERCSGFVEVGFSETGSHRFTTVRDCMVEFGSHADIALGSDKMCSDIIWTGNIWTGVKMPFLHVHEGSAGVLIRDNIWRTGGRSDGFNAISIRARSRDVTVVGNIIDSETTGTLIYVEDTCTGGGIIADNTIMAASGGGIDVNAPGWLVANNRFPNYVYIYVPPTANVQSANYTLACWLTKDRQQMVMGNIQKNSYISDIQIIVTEAFNSSGTDNIRVGDEAFTDNYSQNCDVSSTGVKTVTRTGTTGGITYADGHTVLATYLNGGGEPSTGKALVLVEFTLIPAPA